MLHQVDDAFTARHVRHRAVPRTNRTPATSSRAYQSKSARVEGRHCYAIKWNPARETGRPEHLEKPLKWWLIREKSLRHPVGEPGVRGVK